MGNGRQKVLAFHLLQGYRHGRYRQPHLNDQPGERLMSAKRSSFDRFRSQPSRIHIPPEVQLPQPPPLPPPVATTIPTAAVSCPSCRQQIATPPELAGQLVSCPYCRQQIIMPGGAAQPVSVNTSLTLIETRRELGQHHHHHHYHPWFWADPFYGHWSYWVSALIALAVAAAIFMHSIKESDRLMEKAVDEQIRLQQEIVGGR